MSSERDRLATLLHETQVGCLPTPLSPCPGSKAHVPAADRLRAATPAEPAVTPAGDERLREAAIKTRDLIANFLWNEDDSGDDNDLEAAYEELRGILGPSTEEGIGETFRALEANREPADPDELVKAIPGSRRDEWDQHSRASREPAVTPARSDRERALEEALEEEVRRLEQPDGLHEYGKGGIHKMPGCRACEMLARLRAALREPATAGTVDDLGAAWAAAEAALPEGWLELRLTLRRNGVIGPYAASVHDGSQGAMADRLGVAAAHGSKPAIAVARLAARLAAESSEPR